MKNSVILLLAALALSACKKEVSKYIDQDKIWTHFELFYDANENKTYATATFRFSHSNGTRLELSDPSTVSFNDQEMAFLPEGEYQLVFDGYVNAGTFRWSDLDGKEFTNSIEIHEVDFLGDIPTWFFADSITYINWDGAAVDSFETMTLTLDGPLASDTKVYTVDTVQAFQFALDSAQLSQLDSGLVSVILDRRYKPALQEQTSKGGVITGRFRPVNKTTNVQ